MSGGGLTLGLMKETMGPGGGGVYEVQNQVDSISRMGEYKQNGKGKRSKTNPKGTAGLRKQDGAERVRLNQRIGS